MPCLDEDGSHLAPEAQGMVHRSSNICFQLWSLYSSPGVEGGG